MTFISRASISIIALHWVAADPLVSYCQEFVHSAPLHRSFANEQNQGNGELQNFSLTYP